jgi:hypothetical protein
MTDPIEGEFIEKGLAPIVAGPPARLSDVDPERMIAVASKLASTLKRIVDDRKLYAMISGRKYPTVEAWMTIGRMDNTVAQEESVTRQDDGSYVATAVLVRLSDGAIVGRASALCGAPDDKPWSSRPEYNRRSMAVTRAISRAFRAQYSWIMALAGYEPTPAEEMPHDDAPRPAQTAARPRAAEPPTNTPPTVTDADMADLTATATPSADMTITELQRRAAGATIGISDLNVKSRELFGKNINLLTNAERQTVAVEMELA